MFVHCDSKTSDKTLCFLTVEDVLENIPDSHHKCFIKQYLKDWPYPHVTQYRVGQFLNAELNGVPQRCEVQVVDCSLVQVIFQVSIIAAAKIMFFPSRVYLKYLTLCSCHTQDNQQKEWIYRGSVRLDQHRARILGLNGVEECNDDSE